MKHILHEEHLMQIISGECIHYFFKHKAKEIMFKIKLNDNYNELLIKGKVALDTEDIQNLQLLQKIERDESFEFFENLLGESNDQYNFSIMAKLINKAEISYTDGILRLRLIRNNG